MLTSQMKPGPRMGGLDKAFLPPHRARSAQQPPLPLSGGKRNGCEARWGFPLSDSGPQRGLKCL